MNVTSSKFYDFEKKSLPSLKDLEKMTPSSNMQSHSINHSYIPQIFQKIENLLGICKPEHTSSFKKKDISLIANIKKANEILQQILCKIEVLWEKGIEEDRLLPSEIKKLDEEVNKIEQRLKEITKNGILKQEELTKELQLTSYFHQMLESMEGYINWQHQYKKTDELLNNSLCKVNDSLSIDFHGLSSITFAEVGKSLKKMKQMIEMTTPLLDKVLSFTPEVLNELENGVIATCFTCSDWLMDFLSHYDKIVSTTEHLWKAAVENGEGSDYEKFMQIKEAGDILLSLHKMLKDLTLLPKFIEIVKTSRNELDISMEHPSLLRMQRHFNLLINDLKEVEEKVPKKLKILEKLIEVNDVENILQEFSKRGEIALKNGKQDSITHCLEEPVRELLKRYQMLSQKEERKLKPYLRLKKHLLAILSLPNIDRCFKEKINLFCMKEESRLNKETGHELNFDDLIHAESLRKGKSSPGLLSRIFNRLNPENWSERTKEIVHIGLVGMQLTEQMIEISEKIQSQKNLKKLSEQKTLTNKEKELIDEEASLINRYLTDHYKSLHKPKNYQNFTKKRPEIRSTLQIVIEKFQDHQPSLQEISEIVENHRLYRQECLHYPQRNISPEAWILNKSVPSPVESLLKQNSSLEEKKSPNTRAKSNAPEVGGLDIPVVKEFDLAKIKNIEMPGVIDQDIRSSKPYDEKELKFLSHVFEIQGFSYINKGETHSITKTMSVGLEGGPESGSITFADVFLKQISSFTKQYPEVIDREEANTLSAILKRSVVNQSCPNSDCLQNVIYDNVFEDIQEGLTTLLHTGFIGHAVIVFFYKDYLVIANKGGGSRRPIEVFKIDKNKITLEKIEEILEMKEKSRENYKKWLETIEEKFGATSYDPFAKFIEGNYPFEPTQHVGNCSWESLETAIYTLLALERLDKLNMNKNQWLDFEEEMRKTNNNFDVLMQFIQVNVLENYMSNKAVDENVLKNVFKTTWKREVWEKKLGRRIESMERQYLEMVPQEDSQFYQINKKVFKTLGFLHPKYRW